MHIFHGNCRNHWPIYAQKIWSMMKPQRRRYSTHVRASASVRIGRAAVLEQNPPRPRIAWRALERERHKDLVTVNRYRTAGTGAYVYSAAYCPDNQRRQRQEKNRNPKVAAAA